MKSWIEALDPSFSFNNIIDPSAPEEDNPFSTPSRKDGEEQMLRTPLTTSQGIPKVMDMEWRSPVPNSIGQELENTRKKMSVPVLNLTFENMERKKLEFAENNAEEVPSGTELNLTAKKSSSMPAPISPNTESGESGQIERLAALVNQLQAKVKLSKEQIADKDQQIENLHKQLLASRKSFEQVPKQYESQLELMTENLKIAREDTKKSNGLLATLMKKDSKQPIPKFSKEGYLTLVKNLQMAQETARAHINHNLYLSQEIDRVQHQHEITLNRYKQMLETAAIEIGVLTKENQRLQIKEKYYSAKYDLESKEAINLEQQVINVQEYNEMKKELDWVKKSYFMSYAVGIKMSQLEAGKNANINIHALYDEAVEKGIPVSAWSSWISQKIMN